MTQIETPLGTFETATDEDRPRNAQHFWTFIQIFATFNAKNVAIESPHNYNLKFYVEKVHKMEML